VVTKEINCRQHKYCYFFNFAKCFDVRGSVLICENPVVLIQYVTINQSIYIFLLIINSMHFFMYLFI